MQRLVRPLWLKLWAVLLVTVFFSAAAQAAVNEKTASDFVNRVGSKVVEIVSEPALSAEEKDRRLEKLFLESVDVDWIAKFVLARHLRKADDSQKQRYFAAYRGYVIKTYTSRFNDYSGEQVKILATRKIDEESVSVDAQIVRPGQENIFLQFFVRADKKNAPLVYDVVIEGVSQLNTQRSEFDAIVNREGIDGLITRLEARK